MANEKSDEEILIQAKNRDADTLLASYSEADEALILKRALARQAERNAKASAADPDEAFRKRLSMASSTTATLGASGTTWAMADEEIAAQSEPEAAPQEASSSLELESLLREWDSERANGTSLEQPEEETSHSFDDVIAWARDAELDQRAADLANDQQAFENAKAMEQFEKDLQSTIGAVRGDLDKEFFDDELVGAWLDKKARDDLSLQQAFIDRQVDPRGWEERKRQLVNGFQKYAQRMPDPAVTQDVMAVAAAVRGANSAPRAEDQDAFNRRISHMGNQEFENYLKEIGAR